MATHGLEASLLVFVVSLLIGGFGIYVGATLALKKKNYSHAVVTALLGALAWLLVDIAFAELGVLGPLASVVGLIVWIWVIKWRYRVGWLRASLIGLGAWLGALIALTVLSILGVSALEAYGVPGV